MSIYVMTVGELAKKRSQPVGEFLKRLQELGVNAGSHAKKLTQEELTQIIGLLDGSTASPVVREDVEKKAAQDVVVTSPNVLMIKLDDRRTLISYVDATLDDEGLIQIKVIESSIENTLGESLLEFRKQLGSKLGVN